MNIGNISEKSSTDYILPVLQSISINANSILSKLNILI